MDATSYVYCSELFPTPLRAQGTGFSVAGLFTATLIYTQTAPTAFAAVGWKFYILIIILPIIGAGLMWKFWPETMLLPLEEIAGLFGDRVALDISHLTTEAREALDKEMAEIQNPEDERIRRVSIGSLGAHAPQEQKVVSKLHVECA